MQAGHDYSTRSVQSGLGRALDRIVAAFEQACHKGQEPQIEAYLRECPQAAEAEAIESLMRIEIHAPAQQGKLLPLEHYLQRFPKHQDLITSLYRPATGSSATQDQSDNWFYLRNRIPVGPFGFEQLKKLAQSGDLRPKDLVSNRSNPDWKEAGTIDGLFAGPSGGKEPKQPVAGQWIRDDYVLLEAVGRGGMGEVFKAYRFSLKKEVALKIVRFDRFQKLSPAQQHSILENFQREMQATANLRHDNIVAIHDTGDHNGLPFYTMDFVEMNLGKIMQFGPVTGKKAAEYIEKVALAVDFANQKGIIHRDIKPPNILVDSGKPILADLGLAAVRDKMREGNQRGEIVGTPPYMAPEQASGQKVDHRTDVYGLGATLYHLLTGRPPHQTADRSKILDQVIHEEPLAPRRLNSAIDRDLEAITMKCLEKDPERRYATAGALAEDLRGYQQDRPISAQRLTWYVRISKWARREPIKAGLAGVIVLLLFILFVSSSWSNSRLSAALKKAEKAQEAAQTAATDLSTALEVAEAEKKRASDMASLLGRRVLKKHKRPEAGDTLRDLIKHVELCERLLEKDPRDELKLELTEGYQELVNYYFGSDKKAETIDFLRKCIQLQEELSQKAPILKVELGLNHLDLGTLHAAGGNREEALKNDNKALELLLELRGLGYNDPIVLAAIGQAQVSVGNDYRDLRLMAECLEHQKEAVSILERLRQGATGNVNVFAFQKELGKAYEEVGVSFNLLERPQPRDALDYFEKAAKMFENKSQFRKNTAEVNLQIGLAHINLKDGKAALSPLEQAKEIVDQLLRELPDKDVQTDQLRLVQANILTGQAMAYDMEREIGKAEDLFKLSVQKRENLAKTGYEYYVVAGYFSLAEFYKKQERDIDALLNYDRAINLQEKALKATPDDYLQLRNAGVHQYNKGLFLVSRKRFLEAFACFERAKNHEIRGFRLTKRSAEYGTFLYATFSRMFEMQFALSKYDEAIDILEERLKVWPEDAGKAVEAAENLAKIYDSDQSPKLLARIIGVFDQALTRKLLDPVEIQANNRYRALMAAPQFAEMIRRHSRE